MNVPFRISVLVLLAVPALACAKDTQSWTQRALAGQPLYATLETTEGDIGVRLLTKDAPNTAANFVGLATGEKEWTDPKAKQPTHAKLYDGTIFHRVIQGFMVQGGDPLGNGSGDPGYTIPDELQSARLFDKVGLLAMANRGPNTSGSQFFITVSTPASLNGHYTIFGEVVSGYDVVEKISHVPTGLIARDRPNSAVVLKTIKIGDHPPKGVKAAAAPAPTKH